MQDEYQKPHSHFAALQDAETPFSRSSSDLGFASEVLEEKQGDELES